MNHQEFSARGGKSRSQSKLKAVRENLAKARNTLKALRQQKRRDAGDSQTAKDTKSRTKGNTKELSPSRLRVPQSGAKKTPNVKERTTQSTAVTTARKSGRLKRTVKGGDVKTC